MDLRKQTNNELITTEQVDLSSLYSIRQFATKWIDNAPPRRLDMIILCANTMTPRGGQVQSSLDGVEATFAVNYLANFHVLSILSPAIRAQPPDREVRILFATCSSYMGGMLPETTPIIPTVPTTLKKNATASAFVLPSAAYGSSKLTLMLFAQAFQKHLSSYVRPDKQPMNARVFMVDPGWCRTPGMRRHLSYGSLAGLLLYLIMYPFWWIVLKSAEDGAETFLFACMDEKVGKSEGGQLLKECRVAKVYKEEVFDEGKQKKVWEMSEKAIEVLEKEGAAVRARERQEKEKREKAEEREKQRVDEQERKPGSRRSRRAANATGVDADG